MSRWSCTEALLESLFRKRLEDEDPCLNITGNPCVQNTVAWGQSVTYGSLSGFRGVGRCCSGPTPAEPIGCKERGICQWFHVHQPDSLWWCLTWVTFGLETSCGWFSGLCIKLVGAVMWSRFSPAWPQFVSPPRDDSQLWRLKQQLLIRPAWLCDDRLMSSDWHFCWATHQKLCCHETDIDWHHPAHGEHPTADMLPCHVTTFTAGPFRAHFCPPRLRSKCDVIFTKEHHPRYRRAIVMENLSSRSQNMDEVLSKIWIG